MAAEIPTCDDGVRCTRDACLAATDACQSTPDDSACPDGTVCYVGAGCTAAPPCEFDTDCLGDGVYCNGDEVCVAGMCMSPSGGRGCDDGNNCTVDECVEASSACANTPYPDFLTNPMHCGTGANNCVACPMPDSGAMHVTASCDAGTCGFACESGWFDTDGNLMNGCECSSPPGSADDPDDSFADTNCDGIDGDESRAIFVAPSGRDTNPGTRALPKRTLAAGILAAQAAGFDVYVSRGDYELVDTLELANGVDIYGGYDESMGWARSDSFIANINGTTTAVRARNISSPTTIDRINVRAANNTAFGGASIGVHAVDSPGLRWRVSLVRAASGAGPRRHERHDGRQRQRRPRLGRWHRVRRGRRLRLLQLRRDATGRPGRRRERLRPHGRLRRARRPRGRQRRAGRRGERGPAPDRAARRARPAAAAAAAARARRARRGRMEQPGRAAAPS
ncbi:MAG: hypothetical protein M5U28_01960 [Sandaracinaceae bacterium]|nr:hypothetical protein [Sandaracinaceae bacterium]